MSFAVVDVESGALALPVCVLQVGRDLRSGIVLKQLGIGPLHAAFGEQAFGRLPGTAQAFQEKDGFGKLRPDTGSDVTPGWHRNLVARVATKAIHAAPAPGYKHLRQMFPGSRIAMIQFDQVFPSDTPRSGADE